MPRLQEEKQRGFPTPAPQSFSQPPAAVELFRGHLRCAGWCSVPPVAGLRAQNNDWANDSVFVQFSGSVDTSSNPVYRIGTASAAEVNLEDCKGCGIAGWGWQDNGWGVNVLGPAIYFATGGPQVLRVQSREDGAIVDQILLSPSKFISAPPGALKNDTTIYPAGDSQGPTVTLARAPYLQQVGESAATVVWATREPGPAEVRYAAAGAAESNVAATSRLVPAAATGLSFDYYQHEATLTGLSPATTYSYNPFVSGVDVTPDSGSLRTAPSDVSGAVTFIGFGDSGTNSSPQHQLASLMAADTFDLALHMGDITYGTTTGVGDASYRGYEEWFFGVYRGWLSSRPFFPVEGNHDSRPTNGNGVAYLDVFSLPRNGASPSTRTMPSATTASTTARCISSPSTPSSRSRT